MYLTSYQPLQNKQWYLFFLTTAFVEHSASRLSSLLPVITVILPTLFSFLKLKMKICKGGKNLIIFSRLFWCLLVVY